MANSTNLDENRIKTLFKEALVEVIEENQDKLSSILIALLRLLYILHDRTTSTSYR